MTRKNKAETKNSQDEETLDRMPVAKAVLKKDTESLTTLLRDALPQAKSVQNLTLTQSVGEAFTGGRSTPVYYVEAEVTNAAGKSKCRKFVIKLVQMPGDDSNPSIVHRRESYAVERRFYEYVATEVRSQLHIPKLLVSDNTGNQADPIACWLMTDGRVQYPLHPVTLDPETHLRRALDWVAKLHAHFWNGNDWRRPLWERGGFWNKHRYSGSVNTSWLSTCQWLAKNQPDYLTSSTKSLGNRLSAMQAPLADFMLTQSKATWSTLIHGDFKAANLFFAESSTKGCGEDAVAAVDFQYAGAGVPAEDVAYILFPDALVEYWDHESDLLEYYHDKLLESLMLSNKGGPSSLPLECFRALYELSRTEMIIHWLQKGWIASTNGDAKLVAALESTMDKIDGGAVLSGNNEYKQALNSFVGTIG